MAGVRILCNQIIPVTDWNHDFVTVKSKLESKSPLPTLASFDLLNPLDNSGHGYTVSPNGGQIRDWGLNYLSGAAPSSTDLVRTGQGAVSFIVAFKLDSIVREFNILSNIAPGVGFNFYYGGGFYLGFTYPSGTAGKISAGGIIAAEVGKWYVAVGVFDPVSKTASVRISDAGLQFGPIGTGFPSNTSLDAPMGIGGKPGGATNTSMFGGIAFAAFYDGAFTATQRDAMVSVGMDILQERGLV
ncbi:hypothetical protein [Klebsiella pneumoniae]|uniref:hypothetical protein n=1 Tax=Klebsiella pneumoniae TaxID=573 RepID=UPI000E2A4BC4|nr:hypothetical protein [Klebsiella pneumoniae]SWU66214.1 Uncharacterised protein [Klebsiella pneumoniae]